MLSAEYIADVWDLFRSDERLRFFLFDRLPSEVEHEWEQIYNTLPTKRIGRIRTYTKRWDLVITADHTKHHWPELVDGLCGPTLFVPHGIASGVRRTGEDFTFGRYAYDQTGKYIRYSRMFVSSEANRKLALSKDRRFGDIVAVVGNLHDDKMLSLAKHREYYRQKFGFKPNEIVIFIMAGYSKGASNLYYTVGDAVLAEARKLLGDFQFILNVHPHEYRPKLHGQRVWGDYLRTQSQYGFIVREPHESWIPCMIACDVILTDQTSLALHGVLLERPVVYAPIPDGLLEKGTLVWRLREISPKIKPDASDLRDRLLDAIHNYPIEALRELANDINSYPGKSAERVLKEVYCLLRLPIPE
jgi:hypothetical protein